MNVIGRAGILKRYPDASEAEYSQAFTEMGLSIDEADSSFNILLLKIGDDTVLVDTGEGGKPHVGHLLESMGLAGIPLESITLVVLTHADGDHVLGLLSDKDEAVFPNARYVISKDEMAYWQRRIDAGLVDQSVIISMMQAKGLRLIAMDEEIIPGMTAVPIPGHTPGQIALLIKSGNEQLMHMADLLHSPMQFAHPEWSAKYDVDTSRSVPTRRAALARAAEETVLTLFYHLPFPGLGRVKPEGQGFTWEPVTSAQ